MTRLSLTPIRATPHPATPSSRSTPNNLTVPPEETSYRIWRNHRFDTLDLLTG